MNDPYVDLKPDKSMTTDGHKCECEHTNHFDDTLDGEPQVRVGHPYGAERSDVRPAFNIPWQEGSGFCDWCLTHCHPKGTRVVPHIKEVS